MPEVVADTSPLQYLHQAGLLHVLSALYGHIVVPEAVLIELERGLSLGFLVPDSHGTLIRVDPAEMPVLPNDFGAGENRLKSFRSHDGPRLP